VVLSACAAPRRAIVAPAQAPASITVAPVPRVGESKRPRVGIAFGGGSARGLAHVGVIRWLEEHRVPIDLAAGTSMGGLVGGSFATGLDAAELTTLLTTLDWDTLFGASNFAFKNIRRKADARAFPSRIEFGVKRGLVAPTSINNGQQVELLLARVTAPYHGVNRFDDLPTPFRAVAVDIVHARQVVLDRGSLAQAMRATMSLPLIFPPVEIDGQLLVDGGAMNNVPADVVRAMGADRVIAVNVGELGDADRIDDTLLGVAGAAIDAMMRVSTRRALADADIVINVPLRTYGSLDWRRSVEIADEGYKAAEALREQLLPLAVSESEFQEWKAERQRRRRTNVTIPAFVTVEGFSRGDSRRIRALLPRHVGVPLDIEALEEDLEYLTGLDRYDTIAWRLVQNADGDTGILVSGRPKPYSPPFMMLGLNLENTTSSDFRITFTARYLAYGIPTSASELRIDGTVGSNPALGAELYMPFGATPLFVAPFAGLFSSTFNVVDEDEDAVFARYRQDFERAGLALGSDLGFNSDIRLRAMVSHVSTDVEIGDPMFPSLSGKETAADLTWRYDGQDSPVVPSVGALVTARVLHVLDNPDVLLNDQRIPLEQDITQFETTANRFWSLGAPNRVFVSGGVGVTWNGEPLPHHEFQMGTPFRLGAFRGGELFGKHYYMVSAGYLRQVARLPDFVGGPIFAGGWLENGDAFEDWDDATLRTNASFGAVLDTLIGPVMVGVSAGFDGRWRTYVGVGRIFR
jgi:NTE family protein